MFFNKLKTLLFSFFVLFVVSAFSQNEPTTGILLGDTAIPSVAFPNITFPSHVANYGLGGWHDTTNHLGISSNLLRAGTAAWNKTLNKLFIYGTNNAWQSYEDYLTNNLANKDYVESALYRVWFWKDVDNTNIYWVARGGTNLTSYLIGEGQTNLLNSFNLTTGNLWQAHLDLKSQVNDLSIFVSTNKVFKFWDSANTNMFWIANNGTNLTSYEIVNGTTNIQSFALVTGDVWKAVSLNHSNILSLTDSLNTNVVSFWKDSALNLFWKSVGGTNLTCYSVSAPSWEVSLYSTSLYFNSGITRPELPYPLPLSLTTQYYSGVRWTGTNLMPASPLAGPGSDPIVLAIPVASNQLNTQYFSTSNAYGTFSLSYPSRLTNIVASYNLVTGDIWSAVSELKESVDFVRSQIIEYKTDRLWDRRESDIFWSGNGGTNLTAYQVSVTTNQNNYRLTHTSLYKSGVGLIFAANSTLVPAPITEGYIYDIQNYALVLESGGLTLSIYEAIETSWISVYTGNYSVLPMTFLPDTNMGYSGTATIDYDVSYTTNIYASYNLVTGDVWRAVEQNRTNIINLSTFIATNKPLQFWDSVTTNIYWKFNGGTNVTSYLINDENQTNVYNSFNLVTGNVWEAVTNLGNQLSSLTELIDTNKVRVVWESEDVYWTFASNTASRWVIEGEATNSVSFVLERNRLQDNLSYIYWEANGGTNLTAREYLEGVTNVYSYNLVTGDIWQAVQNYTPTNRTIGINKNIQNLSEDVQFYIPENSDNVTNWLWQEENNVVTLTRYIGQSLVNVETPAYINGMAVSVIATNCFANSLITNVIIGSGITNIGNSAFSNCVRLVSVYFKQNQQAPAFGGLLVYSGSLGVTNYVDSATALGWSNTYGGRPVVFPKLYGDGSSLTGITPAQIDALWDFYTPASAFMFVTNSGEIYISGLLNTALTSINIPPYISGLPVVGIATEAFVANEDLTSVVFPNTMKTIGDSAFGLCINLSEVSFNTGLTNISEYSFFGTALHSIELSETVRTIGDNGFGGCNSLTSLYFLGNAPSLHTNAFQSTPYVVGYYVYGRTGFEDMGVSRFRHVLKQYAPNLYGSGEFLTGISRLFESNMVWWTHQTNTITRYDVSGGYWEITASQNLYYAGTENAIHLKQGQYKLADTVFPLPSYYTRPVGTNDAFILVDEDNEIITIDYYWQVLNPVWNHLTQYTLVPTDVQASGTATLSWVSFTTNRTHYNLEQIISNLNQSAVYSTNVFGAIYTNRVNKFWDSYISNTYWTAEGATNLSVYQIRGNSTNKIFSYNMGEAVLFRSPDLDFPSSLEYIEEGGRYYLAHIDTSIHPTNHFMTAMFIGGEISYVNASGYLPFSFSLADIYNDYLGMNSGDFEGDETISPLRVNATFFGYRAGESSTGSKNYAFGNEAGRDGVNGNNNYGIGHDSGRTVVGNDNYSLGKETGRSITGSDNYSIGDDAGRTIVGNNNYSLGDNAGRNATGDDRMYLEIIPTAFTAGEATNSSVFLQGGLLSHLYLGRSGNGNYVTLRGRTNFVEGLMISYHDVSATDFVVTDGNESSNSNDFLSIASIYKNSSLVSNRVTITANQSIYRMNLDTAVSISNDISRLDLPYREATWQLLINFRTAASLNSVFATNFLWDSNGLYLSSTGSYRFACSVSETYSNRVQISQILSPERLPAMALPTTGFPTLPRAGMMVYNTTSNAFFGYRTNGWVKLNL